MSDTGQRGDCFHWTDEACAASNGHAGTSYRALGNTVEPTPLPVVTRCSKEGTNFGSVDIRDDTSRRGSFFFLLSLCGVCVCVCGGLLALSPYRDLLTLSLHIGTALPSFLPSGPAKKVSATDTCTTHRCRSVPAGAVSLHPCAFHSGKIRMHAGSAIRARVPKATHRGMAWRGFLSCKLMALKLATSS